MSSVIRGSDNFDSASLLGVGQTWQDVKASRALSTNYTNDTGKPIQVAVSVYGTSAAISAHMLVDAVQVPLGSNNVVNEQVTSAVVIPPGAVYQVVPTAAAAIHAWAELR